MNGMMQESLSLTCDMYPSTQPHSHTQGKCSDITYGVVKPWLPFLVGMRCSDAPSPWLRQGYVSVCKHVSRLLGLSPEYVLQSDLMFTNIATLDDTVSRPMNNRPGYNKFTVFISCFLFDWICMQMLPNDRTFLRFSCCMVYSETGGTRRNTA